jgi:hypothetical protein
VFVPTIRKWLWFVAVLAQSGLCFCAQGAATATVRVTVSVYNDAKVPAEAVASAEAAASRIFRHAGLEVKWIACAPSGDTTSNSPDCRRAAFPTHLHVRILSHSRNLAGSTLGISYLGADGIGCYSDIFFAPVTALHSSSGQEVGSILGYVMAHEIAHLLLGTNSHSVVGIMKARWQAEDLRSAKKGELLFSLAQSQTMRERLASAGRQTVGD